MKTITIEEIKSFRDASKYCMNENKLMRFTDIYLDPTTIKEGLDSLIKKIEMAGMGLDKLTPSDKLLISIIDGQRGILF